MSMPDTDSAETPPDESQAMSAEPSEPTARWSLIAMIVNDGTEPPPQISENEALGTWASVSSLWHPALLARATELPRIESVESPSPPVSGEVRVVAPRSATRLPADYRALIEGAGALLIEATPDRLALVEEIRNRLEPDRPSDVSIDEELAVTALDFFALGTARWWLRDLTIAMGHPDGLDVENLTREVRAGAVAWLEGDCAAAKNRLRAAFEVLTQARERFYPVDAYIIDLCLVDPAIRAGALADSLAARAPVTFIGPAQAIENLAERDPEAIAAIREAVTEGWADIVGGSYAESDEPLLPLESIFWQFRRGGEAYRRLLDDRNVETVARRRFALYPQLPQVVKRFGFRFAVHLGFDAGRFPIRPEAKRLWESPDGTSLETLHRPPLGADKGVQGPSIPWRLAATMKDDHVATLPLVHWPNQCAPWYLDLRRVAGYSPVLARWVTLNDYFHLTDRPYETFRPEPDGYVTPYLAQAIARRDERPISRKAAHASLRARLDALTAVRAMATALTMPGVAEPLPPIEAAEDALETGGVDEARKLLAGSESVWAGALTRGIAGSATGGRPGYLVLNPLGIPRRAAVLLPDAALDLRPEGPLRASQFTEEGVWAIVELPPFGYAWVPREPNLEVPPAVSGALSVRGQTLRNESMTVEIDATTGGIRGLRHPSEETARLGQQLVVTRFDGSLTSRMRAESFEVEYGGPALIQAVTRGALVDSAGDRQLATFRQRYRLWSGRPLLEVDITLSDLDADWLARAGDSDPWTHYLACRWAWPDTNSMLRRTCLLSPELTDAERPETPDAFDISTRKQRTAVLFGGLAHHRRHGPRMLDTLLVAGRESERAFRLGVALDLENPFHAAFDLIGPAFVVPTEAGPPPTGPGGWLFQVDHKSVAVTRLEFLESSDEGRGWGVVLHVIETAGHGARCRLRAFRNPTWARQTDFNGELIVDLPVDGDAVLIDLTPHEMARVEVTLG